MMTKFTFLGELYCIFKKKCSTIRRNAEALGICEECCFRGEKKRENFTDAIYMQLILVNWIH